jgi:hypothetical protein
VGLARLFNPRDLNGNGLVDDFDLLLPISERFFSGGRRLCADSDIRKPPAASHSPQGQFHNTSGDLVE